jgi:hypothetical protein
LVDAADGPLIVQATTEFGDCYIQIGQAVELRVPEPTE